MKTGRGWVLAMTLLSLGCRYEDPEMNLLTSLDKKAVRTIHFPNPNHSCDLHLNGLTSITPAEAEQIARWNPNDPPVTLSREAINDLYGYSRELPPFLFDMGLSYSQTCGFSLKLNGLTTLDETSAKALSKFAGDEIELNGLIELPENVAKALVPSGQHISFHLNGVRTLSVESAKALGSVSSGDLHLAGLENLDTEAYLHLKSHRDVFTLGVRQISVEEAEIIASWDWVKYISFPNLETVTYDQAQVLVTKVQGGYVFDQPDIMDLPTATVFYHWAQDTPRVTWQSNWRSSHGVSVTLARDSTIRTAGMCDAGGLYCSP